MAKIFSSTRASSSRVTQPSTAETSSPPKSPRYETRKGWAGVGDRLQQLAEKFTPAGAGSPAPRVTLNQRGLRRAAAAGDSEAVRFYAAKGIDPNAPSKRGDTALERAMEAGSVLAVRELLSPPPPGAGASDAGGGMNRPPADPNRMGADGLRPLHRAVKAAMQGEGWAMEVIELLANAPGIDLKAPDASGQCPVDLLPPQPKVPSTYRLPQNPIADRIHELLATPADALFHLKRYNFTTIRDAHAALPSFESKEAAISAAMAHIEERLAQAPADRPVIICAGDEHGDMHAAEIAMRSMQLLSQRGKGKGASAPADLAFFSESKDIADRDESGESPGPSAGGLRQKYQKALDGFRKDGTDPVRFIRPGSGSVTAMDNDPDEMNRRAISVFRLAVGLKANAIEHGMPCISIESENYPAWKAKEARQGRDVDESDFQAWRRDRQDSRRRNLRIYGNQQDAGRAEELSDVEREDMQVANVEAFLNEGGAGGVIWPGKAHLPYLREALADRCTFISVAPINHRSLDSLWSLERLSYCISHPDVFAFQSETTTCDAGRFVEMMKSCGLGGGHAAATGEASSGAGDGADSVSRWENHAVASGSGRQ